MRFDYNSLYLGKFRDGDLPCSCGPRCCSHAFSWSLVTDLQGHLLARKNPSKQSSLSFLVNPPKSGRRFLDRQSGLGRMMPQRYFGSEEFSGEGMICSCYPQYFCPPHGPGRPSTVAPDQQDEWTHFPGHNLSPTHYQVLGGRPPFCLVQLVVEDNFLPSFW